MGVPVLASLLLAAAVALPGAPAVAADAQTILHLLDYVGVDYPEAVADGKVKNEDEYREMLEFTAQAAAQLKDLPPNPRREKLVADAESLAALVAAKAGAAAVADAAGELRRALIEAYGVRVAPQRTVELVDAVPAVPWLGVFPTWQTLGAQAIVLAIVVAAFTAARRTKAGPV